MTKPAAPLLVATIALLPACSDSAATGGPMVYVALDQQFSEPLLATFGKVLGVGVRQQHDTEAQKTVGLVSRIIEEKDAPRCDVFWNNELAHTVRLAQMGLLEPYASPAAEDLPAEWRDPQGRWTAFAARARILIVNTELLPESKDWPTSFRDLTDPEWKGRCAVARPLTGTTLTHFTALRKALGDEDFDRFWTAMEQNDVKFLASNGATMREVRDGKLAWAFTDTDDYNVAKKLGYPVACVFPDQGEGHLGTMLIPNSVAIIKGGPDPENARRLVDKILARETEAMLAAGNGAQIPLRAGIRGPADPSILGLGKFRAMRWDVEWVAENLARCSAEFGKRFGL